MNTRVIQILCLKIKMRYWVTDLNSKVIIHYQDQICILHYCFNHNQLGLCLDEEIEKPTVFVEI